MSTSARQLLVLTSRKIGSSLDRLTVNLLQSKKELESKQADMEAQQAEAQRLQARLRALHREVDQAAERLIHADHQFANFEAKLEGLLTAFLDGWGMPEALPEPNYREIVITKAAIEDFPRVRAFLVEKLTVAETALNAFEQELEREQLI